MRPALVELLEDVLHPDLHRPVANLRGDVAEVAGRVGLVTAFPRRVRFRMLNASMRRSKRCVVPTTLKPFRNDTLMSQKPGCRRVFFSCVVANVPAAGARNALRSNQMARDSAGIPVGSARPSDRRPVRRTGCRCPVRLPRYRRRGCARRTALPTAPGRCPRRPSCRAPSAAARPTIRASGSRYRTCDTSTCGRSRSEMP